MKITKENTTQDIDYKELIAQQPRPYGPLASEIEYKDNRPLAVIAVAFFFATSFGSNPVIAVLAVVALLGALVLMRS